MVVCRYFLAGNCKYGDRCFNEHPRGIGPAGGGGGRGVTFRDSFGMAANQQNQNPYKWTAPSNTNQQQQGQQQASGISVQDIVASLPKEMETWQTSKMWPFSCFGLEKELASLPEFIDMSPEELRLDAYNARQQGTMDTFNQKVLHLAQEFRQKQDQIRAMPDTLRQKLTEILEEGRRQKAARGSGQSVVRPSTFGGGQTGGSVFGAAGTSSVFGSSSASNSSSTSIFGNNSSNSPGMSPSIFGMGGSTPHSNSLFGQPSGSVFGGAQATTTSGTSSVFGQSSGSVFGGAQATTTSGTSSIFGQAQPAPGLFGNSALSAPASSSGGSIFGGGAGGGLFAQPSSSVVPAPGLFGKPAAAGGGGFGQPAATGNVFGQSSGGIFGQNAGGGLFGKPSGSSSASVFGQVAVTSPAPGLFGIPSSQSSVFGGGAAASTTTLQPGLFGAAAMGASGSGLGAGSTFGGAAAAAAQVPLANSSSLYTPLSELTESEKAQFEAKMFTAGMIPMRPPPKELINIS